MDPDATWDVIVRFAQIILTKIDGQPCTAVPTSIEADADELAQRVVDLNAWIAKHGYLPKAFVPATTVQTCPFACEECNPTGCDDLA